MVEEVAPGLDWSQVNLNKFKKRKLENIVPSSKLMKIMAMSNVSREEAEKEVEETAVI